MYLAFFSSNCVIILASPISCPQQPEYEDCMDSLTTYVRHQLRRATMEKFEVECDTNAQPIPYLFLTPKGQEIDLRLFSRDIMRKALPILIGILERETRGWFLHFRERLIAEMREKKMPDEEIEEVTLFFNFPIFCYFYEWNSWKWSQTL